MDNDGGFTARKVWSGDIIGGEGTEFSLKGTRDAVQRRREA